MDRSLRFTEQEIKNIRETFTKFWLILPLVDQRLLDELLHDFNIIDAMRRDGRIELASDGVRLHMTPEDYKEFKRLLAKVNEPEKKDLVKRLKLRNAQVAGSAAVDPGFGFDDDPQ